jgi:hypothetical protein
VEEALDETDEVEMLAEVDVEAELVKVDENNPDEDAEEAKRPVEIDMTVELAEEKTMLDDNVIPEDTESVVEEAEEANELEVAVAEDITGEEVVGVEIVVDKGPLIVSVARVLLEEAEATAELISIVALLDRKADVLEATTVLADAIEPDDSTAETEDDAGACELEEETTLPELSAGVLDKDVAKELEEPEGAAVKEDGTMDGCADEEVALGDTDVVTDGVAGEELTGEDTDNGRADEDCVDDKGIVDVGTDDSDTEEVALSADIVDDSWKVDGVLDSV